MSGGHFDRSTYAMCEIADTIERDIARAYNQSRKKFLKTIELFTRKIALAHTIVIKFS